MKLDAGLMIVDLKSLSMGTNRCIEVIALQDVNWDISEVRPAGEEGTLELEVELESRNLICTGRLTAEFLTECARCLEPVPFPVTAPIDRVYTSDPRLLEETDAEPMTVEDGGLVILDAVREAVLLSIPGRPLCSPDCAGICYN